jgi:signal transduction histidine kinase
MNRGRPPLWPLAYALLAAAVVLSIVGYRYRVAVDLPRETARLTASGGLAVAWSFLFAGVIAHRRSHRRRTPLLLIATGLALLIRMLRYGPSSPAFTLGFALGELNLALMTQAVLSYPNGRLHSRVERDVVALGYGLAAVLPLASLLVFDPRVSCFACWAHQHEPHSVIVLHSSNRAWLDLGRTLAILKGVFGAIVLVILARRLLTGTPRERGLRTPLAVAGFALGSRGVAEATLAVVRVNQWNYLWFYWWQLAAEAAIPIALLVGLLRSRFAQATIAELLPSLARATPAGIRDVLARGLSDPSLELLLVGPVDGGFVDCWGRPAEAPESGSARGVTRIEGHDSLLGVIVHHPSLRHDRELLETTTAAASLALENAHLSEELRARIEALGASRARVVAAADAERRRIERNIHDGAQQRLLGIALELRNAERSGDREVIGRAASTAVDELQRAVSELRELAQGLHPSILTEEGLTAALESAAQRSPVPVELRMTLDGRLPPELESTTYFIVSEALANVAKHADATTARVCVSRAHGVVVIEIRDDGVGGADGNGAGLRGIVERVEAHGGRLRLISPPNGGTRLLGEIPCAP